MNYCSNFREKGLADICDLIEDAKDARMEEEKAQQLLKKIPECPVSMKLAFAD